MIGQLLNEFSSAEAAMQELNASQYPRFADLMTKHGYDWEPMTVTTDDDYILTTFHILGKSGQDRSAKASSAGTVLI